VKIELDLPDWVDERHIRIFAGIEEVARRMTNTRYWEVKTSRCNMCGECCKLDGCDKLVFKANEWRCSHLIGRPFCCCCGDHAGQDHCNIRWEQVNG